MVSMKCGATADHRCLVIASSHICGVISLSVNTSSRISLRALSKSSFCKNDKKLHCLCLQLAKIDFPSQLNTIEGQNKITELLSILVLPGNREFKRNRNWNRTQVRYWIPSIFSRQLYSTCWKKLFSPIS